MSYHIYHTDAFIIHSTRIGEADRYLYLFTRDLGLLGAVATGARYLKSKLRYHLEPGRMVSVNLVRGKSAWRLVGSETIEEPSSKEEVVLLLKIGSLLRRLIHGEGEHMELFADLEAISVLMEVSKEHQDIKLADIHLYLLVRVLNALGYWGEYKELSQFVEEPVSPEILTQVPTHRRVLFELAQESLHETQL
jgi:DNA repair protein RecO